MGEPLPYALEMLKIIDAGATGNRPKLVAWVERLAAKVEAEHPGTAERFRRALAADPGDRIVLDAQCALSDYADGMDRLSAEVRQLTEEIKAGREGSP